MTTHADRPVSGSSARPSGGPPYWTRGETILWRYRSSVAPMTVVEDGPERLVAWLPGGTPVLRPVLADGRDLRSVDVVEMFRGGRALRRDVWHGYGSLRIAPTGRPWSVWLFWCDDGRHDCWYVNLEAPHRRDGDGVLSVDHAVDLVVRPDRSVEWMDLDELEGAVLAGRFTRAEADGFLSDAAAAAREVAAWAAPFRDGWECWRADPAWPRPELPAHLVADF
jgi:hypothetical protein